MKASKVTLTMIGIALTVGLDALVRNSGKIRPIKKLSLVLLMIGWSLGLLAQSANAPSITFPASVNVYAGQSVSIAPQVIGLPQSTNLECSASLPSFLTINPSTCVIAGVMPQGVIPPGLPPLPIAVSSPFLMQKPATIDLDLIPATVTFPASVNVYAGQSVSIAPQVLGLPQSVNLECSAASLPTFLTINPSTCVITGVMPQGVIPPGLPPLPITVSSPLMQKPTTIDLDLTPATITFPASVNVYAGQSVSIAPQVLGFPKGANLECSASLPTFLTINPSTCVITGVMPQGVVPPGLPPLPITVSSPLMQKSTTVDLDISQ